MSFSMSINLSLPGGDSFQNVLGSALKACGSAAKTAAKAIGIGLAVILAVGVVVGVARQLGVTNWMADHLNITLYAGSAVVAVITYVGLKALGLSTAAAVGAALIPVIVPVVFTVWAVTVCLRFVGSR